MSRKKIGLFAAGAVILIAAVANPGTSPDAAALADPTPAVSATAAAVSPSATASPTAIPTPSPTMAPTVAPTLTPAPTPAPLAGTVVEVVDGDTVRVELATGLETVRIIGIDTPEVHHPSQPEACFGAEATAFAREALAGQPVTLELDPTQDERDRYDRLLAHVHVGDALYAAEAIAAGYGIHYVYERPSVHASELAAAADAARTADAGIWASCEGRVDLPLIPIVVPAPVAEPDPEPADADCHTSYEPCVPIVAGDLDCGDIGFQVAVIGPDEYRLDGSDNDGRGCESY